MRVRWRNFELPSRVIFEEETLSDTYGKFVAEPFQKGFGITVGNGLRRILLSSIEGAGVTKIKIAGAKHEYTDMEGVVEDVIDIALNVKHLLLQLHTNEEIMLSLKVTKKGAVTAGDITADSRFEIINPDLHICTLSKNIEFHMNLWVRKGRWYVTAEENLEGENDVAIIPVDSIFSPIRKVNYYIEDTRVGKMTNYDRLIMEINTDGTITPKMALVEAAKILRKHLNPFVQYTDLGESFHSKQDVLVGEEGADPEELDQEDDYDQPDEDFLSQEISILDLGNRAFNGLKNASLDTIGDLVQMSEEDLKNLPKLGKTSIKKIIKSLAQNGLFLKDE